MTATRWVIAERNSAACYDHWRDRLRRWWGRRARLVVANSEVGADYWQSTGPSPCIQIIPNGLPADEIARADPLRLDGWQGPLIVAIGRLVAQKEPLDVLRGLAPGMRAGRFHFAWLGEGPLQAELQRLAEELKVADRIHLPGRVDPKVVWQWLRRADVYISLSAYEGHPNAVIEAMAASCPIIVSDIPAHRAILTEDMAILIRDRTVATIERAVDQVLTDSITASTRASLACLRARSWSIPTMVAAYQRAYLGILRTSP